MASAGRRVQVHGANGVIWAEIWDSNKGYLLLVSTPMSGSSRKNATQLQQLPPTDPKLLKQIKKAEKAEREFRKKFKVRTWGEE